MIGRATFRSGIGQVSRWLGRGMRKVPLSSLRPLRDTPSATQQSGRAAGGKLADITDLTYPDFGASFRGRFPEGTSHYPLRKLWELAWLAERFEEHNLTGGSYLGLGVGREPLIYHLTHLAKAVVATDLFSTSDGSISQPIPSTRFGPVRRSSTSRPSPNSCRFFERFTGSSNPAVWR